MIGCLQNFYSLKISSNTVHIKNFTTMLLYQPVTPILVPRIMYCLLYYYIYQPSKQMCHAPQSLPQCMHGPCFRPPPPKVKKLLKLRKMCKCSWNTRCYVEQATNYAMCSQELQLVGLLLYIYLHRRLQLASYRKRLHQLRLYNSSKPFIMISF